MEMYRAQYQTVEVDAATEDEAQDAAFDKLDDEGWGDPVEPVIWAVEVAGP